MPGSPAEKAPVFVLNPSADRKRAADRERWLRETLATEWPGARMEVSARPGDVARLGREAALAGHPVVAGGGDGTVNELVNGLADLPGAVIGVLPMGSGNDFAKSVGISRHRATALRQLRRAEPTPLDLIRFTSDRGDGWCDNTLGLGFDGWANFHAHQNRLFTGSVQYLYAVVRTAFSFGPVNMRIRMDDQPPIEGRYLMAVVCNGAVEGGNFRVAPMADNRDGWMDVVLMGPVGIPGLFLRLPFFLFGTQFRFANIAHHRCKRIEIETDTPLGVHVDGEELGGNEVSCLKAELRPSALQVLRAAPISS